MFRPPSGLFPGSGKAAFTTPKAVSRSLPGGARYLLHPLPSRCCPPSRSPQPQPPLPPPQPPFSPAPAGLGPAPSRLPSGSGACAVSPRARRARRGPQRPFPRQAALPAVTPGARVAQELTGFVGF